MNDNDRNIHILKNVTSIDIPASRVLTSALGENLKSAIVIGYEQDGTEYFASSISGGPEALWIMERFKKMLLELGDE